MNNLIKLTFLVSIASCIAVAPTFADGLIFDPESYPSNGIAATSTSSNSYDYSPTGYYASAPDSSKKNISNSSYKTNVYSSSADSLSVKTRENNNLQKALFELDSAQVDVRNQLLDAKAKYSEIDNQYRSIKEKRKLQHKIVRDGEKRVKQIEKSKENIRKNMQIQ